MSRGAWAAASSALMDFDSNTPSSDLPVTESLRTIVESEGVRVYVTKYSDRPVLCIQTALKHDTYNSSFDISESEIADTKSAVKMVTERVKSDAVTMRRSAVVDLLERDIGLSVDATRALFVEALCDATDNETLERLAIELMERVERIGR